MTQTQFDVIILGSGIGGSTLAAILARRGFRVLMLEKGQHPRFALGEATLPQTSYWLWLISERYDVPEIKNLAEARTVAAHVAPTSGIKRSIGFAYHHAGQAQDMRRESHQVLAPELPFVSESHFYREDIDLYMVRVAQQYGALLQEQTEIVALEIDDASVRVRDQAGVEYRGRYLVDASGFNSIVGKTYALHERPTRLQTQSRSIFTHVEGLRVYDELFPRAELPGLKYRWHDGTLHHLFDGGWFWIIPFDNHCDAQNSKASIGLTLDMRKFPQRSDVSGEQEFNEFVARYPSIARHLAETTATRPYISTGRLQYSCRRAVGQRFFITPQAYGAVDALYSRGLINTFEMTYTFAQRLLDALEADDFALARFAGLDELARRQLDAHDQMVLNAYRALADFEAWSAWLKVWLASKLYGDIWLLRSCLKYMATGNRRVLDQIDLCPPPFAAPLRSLVELSTRALTDAEAGRATWSDAATAITVALRDSDWLPHHTYAWGKPNVHHGDFTPAHRMPLAILWGKTLAPKWVRHELFDFPPLPLAKMQIGEAWARVAGHGDAEGGSGR